jgi:hypothetical protein
MRDAQRESSSRRSQILESGERRLLACRRRQLADDNPLCRNRKIKRRLSEDFPAGWQPALPRTCSAASRSGIST